jgi:Ca2+-binding EF-hand superfamily protein
MVDCPDGKLNPGAFMKIYSKCFPSGNAGEFCEHVFRTFDSDKNGFIDFREFLLAIDVTSAGSPEEKLNWAFSMYDVDGNGWIDLVEMTKIVKSIYKMMGPNQALVDQFETPEKRAEEIFHRMDANSDGRVTRQEFVRSCLNDSKLSELLSPRL